MPATSAELAQLCVNTIKFLSADAVEKAKSGHPGAPMGAADMAYVLWTKHLKFDPADPRWPNRDRFVLSAGHASMLLYSLLHLFEFDLPLAEIERFRQWGSRTPGHPELGLTPGVEVTTGPLGQGFANGVGMALAQRMMRARLGDHADLLDHRVFGLVSDGDVMEGVASEAASLAGHWGLGNLIYLYDDNRISIEGPTALSFSEDVGKRFESYGWHVQRVDGHDHGSVDAALDAAVAELARPSLVVARTTIARGAPNKQGTAKAHGEPLGKEELSGAKDRAVWPLSPSFHVPEDARIHFRAVVEGKKAERAAWLRRFEMFRREDPRASALWDAHFNLELPDDLGARIASAMTTPDAATRTHSGAAIQSAAALVPALVGGSADLEPSNLTTIHGGGDVAPEGLRRDGAIDFAARNLHFGVREHAMGAIGNGIALYGSFIPYIGTFLIFSDYMRPSIRLAALMGTRVIYVFTHDSFFVGEDGPTHQPIEQVPSLRLIPGLHVWRPADGPETAAAWTAAIQRKDGPSALILTRQKVAGLARQEEFDRRRIERGGYVVADAEGGRAQVVIVATGSEVSLAEEARALLMLSGIGARTVSMPCLEIFLRQPDSYRDSVIPAGSRCVVIEAARVGAWCEHLGHDPLLIGLERFGASAPAGVLAEQFGFTPRSVTDRILKWLGKG